MDEQPTFEMPTLDETRAKLVAAVRKSDDLAGLLLHGEPPIMTVAHVRDSAVLSQTTFTLFSGYARIQQHPAHGRPSRWRDEYEIAGLFGRVLTDIKTADLPS